MPASTIEVRVGKVPGEIRNYVLNGDRTVRAALEAAGLNGEGYEIRLNGNTTDEEHSVKANDTVLLAKQIKGN